MHRKSPIKSQSEEIESAELESNLIEGQLDVVRPCTYS